MRRLLIVLAAFALLGAAPTAASPTIRLAIVHAVRGCHIWSSTKPLGRSTTLSVKRGTALTIRISCPMDFDLAQTAGPTLALGSPSLYQGTTRTIVFRKPGLYRFTATNVQTSAEQGLQTLGDDNVLTLSVRVR